jgi:hypothetical protein
MSTDQLHTAQQAVVDAVAQLRALEEAASGQELIDNLKFHQRLRHQSKHDVLRVIARLDRDGGNPSTSAKNNAPPPRTSAEPLPRETADAPTPDVIDQS